MWHPNSNEMLHFKHYERDLIDDITKQRLQARYRIFAARNPKTKVKKKSTLADALVFVFAHLSVHQRRPKT